MILKFFIKFFLFKFLFLSTLLAHDCITLTQAKLILEGFPKIPITDFENDITLEEALKLIANKKAKGPTKKKFYKRS